MRPPCRWRPKFCFSLNNLRTAPVSKTAYRLCCDPFLYIIVTYGTVSFLYRYVAECSVVEPES